MRVCVIGTSTGIGNALCAELARHGHDIWLVSRSVAGLHAAHASVADIRDAGSLTRLLDDMSHAGWQPDCITIAAGIQEDDMENGFDATQAHNVLATNLEGPLQCVSLFLPDFLQRRAGSIIVLCSTSALRPSLHSASYAASKAGLAMAWRSLQLRYARSGVRFGIVYLGPVQTDMWEGGAHMLVPSAGQAAHAIAHFIGSRKSTLYYPCISTILLRLSAWLPDRTFALLSRFLLKR